MGKKVKKKTKSKKITKRKRERNFTKMEKHFFLVGANTLQMAQVADFFSDSLRQASWYTWPHGYAFESPVNDFHFFISHLFVCFFQAADEFQPGTLPTVQKKTSAGEWVMRQSKT